MNDKMISEHLNKYREPTTPTKAARRNSWTSLKDRKRGNEIQMEVLQGSFVHPYTPEMFKTLRSKNV